MYFRLDDPVYLYHELRRQSLTAEDETEFIAQVFKVLNRYLFVEKGVVYRREGEGHYDAVFRYGAATLPERIDRKERPVYFELLQSSRKVVFSRFPERHGFLVAIPVFGTLSDEPVLLLMIERIRFVMLTARSSQSLKAVSLLLRGIFERKFQREELQSVSAAKSALVLDRETTRRALPGRLAFLDEAGIPWRAVAVKTGEAANLDELALKMELALRILDEMYLLDGEIVAVLLFTEHTGAVFARLRGAGIGADDIREYPRADLQARLARAS